MQNGQMMSRDPKDKENKNKKCKFNRKNLNNWNKDKGKEE
jgi:hypothetical protein